MTSFKKLLFVLPLSMAVIMPAYAESDLSKLIKEGTFFGEIRYRYEHVKQDNALRNANANTTRAGIGYKTGVYKGFQGLAEWQVVQHFNHDFNDLTNGNTGFSTVADPEVRELNQALISYEGIPDTKITVGRQKINLDNQRFVGTVNWRQNDQTFDAALFENASIDDLNLTYGYINNVNRILGDDAPLGDLDSQTHIINARYDFSDWFKLTGYGYLLNFDDAPGLSSQTYGLRAVGSAPINDNWSFFYEAEAAIQSDYGDNTTSYDEEYYHIAPGVKGHGFTFQVGYEELGGDGVNEFETPLATGHKFNGFADLFLDTPDAGLEDAYAKIGYKVSNTDTILDGTKAAAFYHKFDGNNGGDFGSEFDFTISKTFEMPEKYPFKTVTPLIRYANYSAEDAPFVDEQVAVFEIKVKF